MIYKKVIIESEADLPKDGEYIVHHKRADRISEMDINLCGVSIDAIEFETNYWMYNFDWYLLPQTEEEYMREEFVRFVLNETYKRISR